MATTRICVKGLPAYVNEARLREHFGSQGEITDVKIIRSSDGVSRLFGFVGYRSESQAAGAVTYFNRTFLDTSRLAVEAARPVGDSALPRPWSRFSEGSSAHSRLTATGVLPAAHAPTAPAGKARPRAGKPVSGPDAADEGTIPLGKKDGPVKKGETRDDDEKLRDFMETMQPRRRWANDAVAEEGAQANGTAVRRAKGADVMDKAREMIDIPFGDEDYFGDDGDDEAAPERAEDVMDAAVSDLGYLRRRVTKDLDGDAAAERDGSDDNGKNYDVSEQGKAEGDDSEGGEAVVDIQCEGNQHVENEEGGNDDVEPVEDTGRLFIRNLSYGATEDDLRSLFECHGEISALHLVKDKATQLSKGYAYVTFMLPEAASRALRALDGAIFQGRLLHLLPARRSPAEIASAAAADAAAAAVNVNEGGGKRSGPAGSSVFKTEREAARKAGAAAPAAWNTLFLRADTVAAAVAARLGLKKGELLDPAAGDVAVRLALGETQVLADTKRGLEEAGVSVQALEAAARAADAAGAEAASIPRSRTVLLVKNLPYNTEANELAELFGRHGALGRLALPSTRALAVIEFLEPRCASIAFGALAYSRFKSVPLYLEWAPEGILAGPVPTNPKPRVESATAVGDGDVDDGDDAEARTVYVKNLAFATTGPQLQKFFAGALRPKGGGPGTVRAARVVTRAGTGKHAGHVLSCGYGFVELATPEAARAALRTLQGSDLAGHALQLSLSRGGGSHEEPGAARATTGAGLGSTGGGPAGWTSDPSLSSTKLVVRNVPFEATRKDLRSLFAPFGQMASLRLPRKFDGHHRGFAFVDFVTAQEAASAYEAVRGTHLYGRHLVMERAKASEGLDEIRERAGKQLNSDPSLEVAKAAGSMARGKRSEREEGKAITAAGLKLRKKGHTTMDS